MSLCVSWRTFVFVCVCVCVCDVLFSEWREAFSAASDCFSLTISSTFGEVRPHFSRDQITFSYLTHSVYCVREEVHLFFLHYSVRHIVFYTSSILKNPFSQMCVKYRCTFCTCRLNCMCVNWTAFIEFLCTGGNFTLTQSFAVLALVTFSMKDNFHDIYGNVIHHFVTFMCRVLITEKFSCHVTEKTGFMLL